MKKVVGVAKRSLSKYRSCELDSDSYKDFANNF